MAAEATGVPTPSIWPLLLPYGRYIKIRTTTETNGKQREDQAMDDLVALLKVADEDEAAARYCSPAPWQASPRGIYVDDAEGKRLAQVAFSDDGLHIARHDPARVLRDVAAKRALVAALEAALDALGRHQHKITDSKGTICAGCLNDWPCPDIKAIEDALGSVRQDPDHHGDERQAAAESTVEQHEVDPI